MISLLDKSTNRNYIVCERESKSCLIPIEFPLKGEDGPEKLTYKVKLSNI